MGKGGAFHLGYCKVVIWIGRLVGAFANTLVTVVDAVVAAAALCRPSAAARMKNAHPSSTCQLYCATAVVLSLLMATQETVHTVCGFVCCVLCGLGCRRHLTQACDPLTLGHFKAHAYAQACAIRWCRQKPVHIVKAAAAVCAL